MCIRYPLSVHKPFDTRHSSQNKHHIKNWIANWVRETKVITPRQYEPLEAREEIIGSIDAVPRSNNLLRDVGCNIARENNDKLHTPFACFFSEHRSVPYDEASRK